MCVECGAKIKLCLKNTNKRGNYLAAARQAEIKKACNHNLALNPVGCALVVANKRIQEGFTTTVPYRNNM
jgi:hypothetical protein